MANEYDEWLAARVQTAVTNADITYVPSWTGSDFVQMPLEQWERIVQAVEAMTEKGDEEDAESKNTTNQDKGFGSFRCGNCNLVYMRGVHNRVLTDACPSCGAVAWVWELLAVEEAEEGFFSDEEEDGGFDEDIAEDDESEESGT